MTKATQKIDDKIISHLKKELGEDHPEFKVLTHLLNQSNTGPTIDDSIEQKIENCTTRVLDEAEFLVDRLPADFYQYLANSFDHYFDKQNGDYEALYISQIARHIMDLNAGVLLIKEALKNLRRSRREAAGIVQKFVRKDCLV